MVHDSENGMASEERDKVFNRSGIFCSPTRVEKFNDMFCSKIFFEIFGAEKMGEGSYLVDDLLAAFDFFRKTEFRLWLDSGRATRPVDRTGPLLCGTGTGPVLGSVSGSGLGPGVGRVRARVSILVNRPSRVGPGPGPN
ncbi:unnamed protein product [Cuscuta europaea]|uniref:Uncharacterized protein n=1 Tax=Cuscuta europaea TaxID=41803 RepID=A0A9P0YU37_CUSEU|nr:unnamed protein product [Cuscuta europaea]